MPGGSDAAGPERRLRPFRCLGGLALVVLMVFPTTGQVISTVDVTGPGIQIGSAVSTDAQGNAYFAGFTDSRSLTVPRLTSSPSCPGGTDVYVIKFAAGTNTPVWGRCFGGSYDDRAYAVAVGPDGSIYVAGSTNSLDFPGGANTILRSAGGLDGFVTKLSSDGKVLIWSRLIGGNSNDRINAIYVSASGDIYVGGETQSLDLPVVNAITPRLAGYQNGFLAHLDSAGNIRYCTYVGGSGHDRVLAVSTDSQGNLYAAGSTDSPNFPTVNALTPIRPGAVSGFVLKLRADGNQLLFGTYLGGSQGMLGAEQVNALAVSQAGVMYLGGITSSTDFPTLNAYQPVFRGWNTDGFLTGISADGKLLFSTLLGGSQGDNITGLALNETNGAITVSGPTMSLDFPGLSAPGSFIVRFSVSGQYQQTLPGLDANVSVAAIAAAPGNSQNLAVAGTRQTVGQPTGFFAEITPPSPTSPALLWWNSATSQVKKWLFGGAQGNVYNGSVWLNQTSVPGWAVVAWADFNGDGVPDLVWQNQVTRQVSVAYMSASGSVIGANWFSQAGQPGWSVVAVADSNRDGVPDLIWQNDTTRQVKVWYMGGPQGNVNIGWTWLYQTGVPGWKIVAAADLNHDGVPDLIWMNDTTRQASVGYMGGSQGDVVIGSNWINQFGMAGWKVVAAADLNGDGTVDLIWQNDTTAQVFVWYLGGSAGNVIMGSNWLDTTGTPGWNLVAAQPLQITVP